jgi:hypothetical protein
MTTKAFMSWKPSMPVTKIKRGASSGTNCFSGGTAYTTQFLDRDNRAHYGQARIKNRLIANLDPDEWSLPPKPKWMRWPK